MLKMRFSVFEIPSLILLDNKGNVISYDALDDIKKLTKP